MSNYTEKRRAGGGRLTVQVLASMITVTPSGSDDLLVTYSHAIDVANLDPSEFTTTPGSMVPLSAIQPSPTTILLQFGENIEAQTSLHYIGNASYVQSPQTIAIT